MSPRSLLFAPLVLFVTLTTSTTGLAEKAKAPPPPAKTAKKADKEPMELAVAYLKALDGSGDAQARKLLLGGVPLVAKDYSIPNWRIVFEDVSVKREVQRVRDAVDKMKSLDAAGHRALSNVLKGRRPPGKAIDRGDARIIVSETELLAEGFRAGFPLFAYCARVGKDVYWHPKNPWRRLLDEMGGDGMYHLEVHIFPIEEQTDARSSRVWPLRVLRIKTNKGFDSGWKVLPASDWEPEY